MFVFSNKFNVKSKTCMLTVHEYCVFNTISFYYQNNLDLTGVICIKHSAITQRFDVRGSFIVLSPALFHYAKHSS